MSPSQQDGRDTAVEFQDVGLRVAGPREGDSRAILQNVSLKILAGETVAVLGRSGSGKTTLLRMINALIIPTEGKILVHGRPLAEWNILELRRRTGYVIQEAGLFPHLTAEANVGILPRLMDVPRSAVTMRVRELFAMVGLDADVFSTRYPFQLSGGQRQRLGVARALAANPDMLLMDEPFGALDPVTRVEMQQMLRDLLLKLSTTVVLVTHDLEEALRLASRLMLVEAGHVVADLPAVDFMRSEIPQVVEYKNAFRHDALDRQSGIAKSTAAPGQLP